MAKKQRRTWLSKQPRWAQKAYQQARNFYSPITARQKIRELIAAPARDFKVAAGGAKAFLKGDRSKHPLAISERQLRIKRSGLTPEAQAAGVERSEASYKKGRAGQIAADRQRKSTLLKRLAGQARIEDEQKAKAAQLDYLRSWDGKQYRSTEKGRQDYENNRKRWVAGETLSWQEYANLSDYARATSDPIVRILRTSPKVRPEALNAIAAE